MIGKVTISPDVIREVARITTLATPGVLAMAERASARGPARSATAEAGGVDVSVRNDQVHVRLRVIASSDVSLPRLGQQIQGNVAGAITEIAGMVVASVDVSFEDVRSKA